MESKDRTSKWSKSRNQRQRRYKDLIENDKELCLTVIVFFGVKNKNQRKHLATGMFLSNGNPTEAVDVIQFCWTGKWPESRNLQLKIYH